MDPDEVPAPDEMPDDEHHNGFGGFGGFGGQWDDNSDANDALPEARVLRDEIASAMWDDYVDVLNDRDQEKLSSLDEDDLYSVS
jgi:hypothetical protein